MKGFHGGRRLIRKLSLALATLCLAGVLHAQIPANRNSQATAGKTAQAPQQRSSLVARVGSTGFVQLRAPSFKSLTPKEQQLAYWLGQASIAIDPIIYDQLSAYGVRQKRMLEEIVSHSEGIDPATLKKITSY